MGISENNSLLESKPKTDLIIVWLDKSVNNEENLKYQEQMKSCLSKKYNIILYPVKTINESVSKLKNIEFTKTIIIVSGKFYEEFVEQFCSIQDELLLKENIVVFCGSKKGFLFWCENNNIYIDDYLVFDRFEDLMNYLIEQSIDVNYGEYSFEIIRNNNELILPLFYQDFFTVPTNESIYLFHKLLKDNYKNNIIISNLLEQIDNVYDMNTLCKFWMRIYSEDTEFFEEMNKDLRKRKNIFKYMTFIKIFYQSVKLNIFEPMFKILYRGSTISKKEFENFIKFQKEQMKKPKLKMIIYSITFLSFSQERTIAEQFLLNKNEENIKILFEVIPINYNDTDINNEKNSYIDISKISYNKSELEVLFGPFSIFKFVSLENISNKSYYTNNTYIIRLEYLGKYRKEILKEFEEDNILNFIPPTRFSHELVKFGLFQMNYKLIWSIRKKLIKKLDNILYIKNNIIASINKAILVLKKNFEIIDEKVFFCEKIKGIKKFNDNIIILYSSKILKILEFIENNNKCEYSLKQDISFIDENIEFIYILSNKSFLVITDSNIKILNKINNKYFTECEYEPHLSIFISIIKLPNKESTYLNNIYYVSLSYEGEMIFWKNNLENLGNLYLSEKPINQDMMIFKNYIIIILESSISLVDYNEKREVFIFSLDYKPISFNKLTDDSFLISMINKKNNYFFNEYKIYNEDNKVLIENLGNSSIEKKKIIKIINLSNYEIITLSDNELIFWKKNRYLKNKSPKKNLLKIKIIEKENIHFFNNLTNIGTNVSLENPSFFTLNGFKSELNKEDILSNNISILDKTNNYINMNDNQKNEESQFYNNSESFFY